MTTSTSRAVEPDGGVGSELADGGQALGVAAGADDRAGTQSLGDLHGHPARASGSTQNQHGLTGLKIDALAKGYPRGHHGIHRRGHQDGIG